MTTTLELHVRKIQWFCQQGEGFCMHVFSSMLLLGKLGFCDLKRFKYIHKHNCMLNYYM
jgi:hypothetical protein